MYSSATRIADEALYDSNGTYTVMPSLTCPRDIDKFTVEKVHGNGDLTYPIGMLTSDEIYLAGNTNYNKNNPVQILTYLTIPSRTYWTLSPNGFYVGESGVYIVGDAGISNSDLNRTDRGIRPAISLNNQTYITSGNGTFTRPYKVG